MGDPIFFKRTKLILEELFFLSLTINDKILSKSLNLKNLFNDEGNPALLI